MGRNNNCLSSLYRIMSIMIDKLSFLYQMVNNSTSVTFHNMCFHFVSFSHFPDVTLITIDYNWEGCAHVTEKLILKPCTFSKRYYQFQLKCVTLIFVNLLIIILAVIIVWYYSASSWFKIQEFVLSTQASVEAWSTHRQAQYITFFLQTIKYIISYHSIWN
jgi:hypothetical protein